MTLKFRYFSAINNTLQKYSLFRLTCLIDTLPVAVGDFILEGTRFKARQNTY